MIMENLGSLLTQDNRLFTFHSPLPSHQVLQLLRFEGREAMSELFRFNVQLIAHDPNIELKKLIGQQVRIGITLADGSMRYISALVSNFVHVGVDKQVAHYHAELVPWLWVLSRRRDSRIFQDKSTEEIVREVLAHYPALADYEFRLSKPLEPVSYCTQYEESDLNFVLRLLENEGLFFMFQHREDGHRLIIADDSDRLKPLVAQPVIRYHGASAVETEDSITEWSGARHFQPSALSLKTFNYKYPRDSNWVHLKSINEQGDVGELEVFQYEGLYGYPNLEAGDAKARHRLEAMEVQGKVFDGKSTCRAMEPGHTFELTQHYDHDDGQPEDRHFLLLAVDHYGHNNYSNQGGAGYSNTFTCIRRKIPFRPSLDTPRGVISGPQTAIVTGPRGEEIFTDELGRVKVKFHWDRNGTSDDRSSCWVRVAQAAASGGFGSIQIPRVGDEVIVAFLDGNPDRPLIIGSLYNGINSPPWALPAQKTQSGFLTRSIKGDARTANALRFDDKTGAEQVLVHAHRNLNISVQADESRSVGGNRRTIVSGMHSEIIKLESSVIVEDGNYCVSVEQGVLALKATTAISLEVGSSKLVMHPDGRILLSGVTVDIKGSTAINLN